MEFGSDFHAVFDYEGPPHLIQSYNPVFFADGRMAIQHLVRLNRWHRIWIPKYFCYEVIDAIESTGIEVLLYPDFPNANDQDIINSLAFEPNDVLLRMNYFGLRGWRDNSKIPVDVIEDHSHGLHTQWAQNSNAAFCIASLRKTMPIPEGGIAWSPKNIHIALPPISSLENDLLSLNRHYGMYRKRMYLLNYDNDKDAFRKLLIETEYGFNNLEICGMSNLNQAIFSKIDALAFDNAKKENWCNLYNMLPPEIDVLTPENDGCCPFSLILKFKQIEDMNIIKSRLIAKSVYPAVLWQIPDRTFTNESSGCYLSVHCDARYNNKDIRLLANILYDVYYNKQY